MNESEGSKLNPADLSLQVDTIRQGGASRLDAWRAVRDKQGIPGSNRSERPPAVPPQQPPGNEIQVTQTGQASTAETRSLSEYYESDEIDSQTGRKIWKHISEHPSRQAQLEEMPVRQPQIEQTSTGINFEERQAQREQEIAASQENGIFVQGVAKKIPEGILDQVAQESSGEPPTTKIADNTIPNERKGETNVTPAFEEPSAESTLSSEETGISEQESSDRLRSGSDETFWERATNQEFPIEERIATAQRLATEAVLVGDGSPVSSLAQNLRANQDLAVDRSQNYQQQINGLNEELGNTSDDRRKAFLEQQLQYTSEAKRVNDEVGRFLEEIRVNDIDQPDAEARIRDKRLDALRVANSYQDQRLEQKPPVNTSELEQKAPSVETSVPEITNQQRDLARQRIQAIMDEAKKNGEQIDVAEAVRRLRIAAGQVGTEQKTEPEVSAEDLAGAGRILQEIVTQVKRDEGRDLSYEEAAQILHQRANDSGQ